jgi:anti-sigma28 factor (negative regulator of flagellin synthesis)
MDMPIDLATSAVNDVTGAYIHPAKLPTSTAQSSTLPEHHYIVTSVGNLVTAAMKVLAVRTDKVAALKEAVVNGTYAIAPHEIASAILANGFGKPL